MEVVAEQGSPADFAEWMQAEQRRVFRLCLRLLRDRYEADSATQDVFIEAFQAMSFTGSRQIRKPAKWLTRVAFNTCYDRMRSRRWRFWQRRSSGPANESLLEKIPATRLNPEDSAAALDIRRRMEAALKRLSPRQRAIFILRHDEDRSLDDIAGITGLDPGTVKAHMARAIKKLRLELRDLYVR